MPKDFNHKRIIGIPIGDFTGIYHAIAEKANINGGLTLEGKEINLFYNAKNTIDKNKSIFIFDGVTYDENGQIYNCNVPYIAENDATVVKLNYFVPPPEDFIKAEEARIRNDAALQQVKKYVALQKEEMAKQKLEHEKTVKKIANSWAATYGVNNSNGEFNKFIEKLYDAAKILNITKTNNGTTKENFKSSAIYPTIEDQIVDEMCAAFANESSFDTRANHRNTYYGIFQFSQIGIDDLKQNKYIPNLAPIEGNKISNFTKLTRLQQLDYMIAYVLNCKKYRSNVEGAEISTREMYALWVSPYVLKKNVPKEEKLKAERILSKRNSVIKAKLAERDKANPMQ